MFVKERFELKDDGLETLIPKFGYNGFGELVFYRTYSRMTKEGKQEEWIDVVRRVINGVFSIRKDHYIKNHFDWDEGFWQDYARKMAKSMFLMEWIPPGRGLWAMGTDFVYERGAMALYNCAYTDLGRDLGDDYSWLMDSLMHGVGVGFNPRRDAYLKVHSIDDRKTYKYVIPDSREGWCQSVRLLINAILNEDSLVPEFDYSQIRKKGLAIRGFGGLSSGPEPLQELHQNIVIVSDKFLKEEIDCVMWKADIANMIGCCVVAGNVRRSAEIACGSINDLTFMDLKDYQKYPYREAHGWMSNNSVILQSNEDFEKLNMIAERVIKNGEPGYINANNLIKGRIGKDDGLLPDRAIGFNPCGEIPLENKEVCNLAETCPTRCATVERWLKACEYATFYCSTVSLLPTHQESTNRVIARNRRIGVSIIDLTGWIANESLSKVTRYLRDGYKVVRATNSWANGDAGVPRAIRVTTMKPGGTVPKVVGGNSGFTYANFKHMIRRIRIQEDSPICRLMMEANIPYEKDVYSKNTLVFEYPICTGETKDMSRVSLWEQAWLLVLVQREWADNAVSNTLNFRPKWPAIAFHDDSYVRRTDDGIQVIQRNDGASFLYPDDDNHDWEETKFGGVLIKRFDPNHEEDVIEQVLTMIAPFTKSVSLLPYTQYGVYPQMPEEGISEQEYYSRLETIEAIDWSQFSNSDGQDELYCSGASCEIKHEKS